MPPTADQIAGAEAQIVEQSKRIEFYLTEYSVEFLATKMRNGEFQIPLYQREDTWEPQRKSRFATVNPSPATKIADATGRNQTSFGAT